MKKIILTIILFTAASLSAAQPLSMNDCYGRWQDETYLFTLNRNFTALVVIFVNPTTAYVFNGVFSIEKDNMIRINISEMKCGPRSSALSKSGFTKTASSRFVFAVQPSSVRGKTLILKPAEVTIDGNNSEGYFDQVISLKKN